MTTTKAKLFDRNGNQIEDHGGPLKDGERRSFPMSMMDHAMNGHLGVQTVTDSLPVRHSPGYCVPPMTDAELVNSEAAMAARKKAMSVAWQNTPAKPAVPPLAKKDEAPATPETDTESLLQARDRRLTTAWATPQAPLPATADTSTVPKPVSPTTVTAADVDAAIAARDARLENAWRTA
jgi:hypothetical protein